MKVLEKVILEADPILSDLNWILSDFEQISKKTAFQRDLDLQKKYGLSQAKE